MWLLMNLLFWSEKAAFQRASCHKRRVRHVVRVVIIRAYYNKEAFTSVLNKPAEDDSIMWLRSFPEILHGKTLHNFESAEALKCCSNLTTPLFLCICWMFAFNVWVLSLCLSRAQGCKWSATAPGNTWQEVPSPAQQINEQTRASVSLTTDYHKVPFFIMLLQWREKAAVVQVIYGTYPLTSLWSTR